MDKLLSVQETGELLGISRSSVYRLVRRGDLIGVRFGPEMLKFRPADVEALVQSKRVTA